MLNIDAETALSFNIDWGGRHWLLRLNGGEWQLLLDGAVRHVYRRAKWTDALAHALDIVTEA